MPSGLIALLDDVAAIARVAATSVDDIGVAAARAGGKTAGVVIDDAAVTPRYLTGFAPARELPVIWRITKGSLFNKLVLLLPAAILLGQFAPFLIPVILLLGGLFLSYEAAAKVLELFKSDKGKTPKEPVVEKGGDKEDAMVAGAIRTDLILSGEIMAIALSEVTAQPWWQQTIILALIAIAVTVVIYGSVSLIVKMDDVGLYLAKTREGAVASFGRGLVNFMPKLLAAISLIGTLAMAWVGGGLLIHNAAALGWHWPEHAIEAVVHPLAMAAPENLTGFIEWLGFAVLSGLLAIAIGALLAPLVNKIVPHGDGH